MKRFFRVRDFHPDPDRDVSEEIRTHLELKTEELMVGGLSKEEAWAEAKRCFGDVGRIQAETSALALSRERMTRLRDRLDTLRQDLRYGIRVLRRAPGFTAVTVFILALGIGVNTTLFSVFKGIFLDPLPLPEAEELVFVWERNAELPLFPASFANYRDWREENRTFEEMGAFLARPVNLTDQEDPVQLRGVMVTASLFQALGVEAALGRTFSPEEGEDGATVVVLGHDLWRSRYGGDPQLLGAAIQINGDPYTVLGVMPRAFQLPDAWAQEPVEIWTPLPFGSAFEPRHSHSYQVLGRLRDGVSLETAREDLDRVAAQLADAYPETNAGAGIRAEEVHGVLFGEVGSQILIVLAAAGLVLLIACGNIASLYLARAAGRRTEMAVRSALGAGRGRVMRQLLTESALVSLAGGVTGVLLAYWSLGAVRSLLPASLPRTGNIRVDGWALLFALGASALTGLLFGLAPAISASKARLSEALRAGRREGGRGGDHSKVQNAFIVSQLALSLVLANAALLLFQSYGNLRTTDPGFRADNVLTITLSLRGGQYRDFGERTAFYEQLLPRLAAVPGVTTVGGTTSLPLQGGSNIRAITDDQWPNVPANHGWLVDFDQVTGDYFQTMGIPLLAGRHLREGEDDSDENSGILVNQASAQALWPGEDPLGKRLSFSDDPPRWMTVVGVVGDTRQWSLAMDPNPEVYFLYSALPTGRMSLALRTEGEPERFAGAVQEEIRHVDPLQAISGVRTMEEIVQGHLSRREFYTTLIGGFSALALLLAAAGIYGVISFFVARRTHEIGIRLALGAGREGILTLVVRRVVWMAILGLGLGLVGVVASTRVVRGLLHGVRPLDPPTLAGGAGFLLAVGLLAASLPAFKASRVSPATALRDE
jgi:putative ABC transport system permease protein